MGETGLSGAHKRAIFDCQRLGPGSGRFHIFNQHRTAQPAGSCVTRSWSPVKSWDEGNSRGPRQRVHLEKHIHVRAHVRYRVGCPFRGDGPVHESGTIFVCENKLDPPVLASSPAYPSPGQKPALFSNLFRPVLVRRQQVLGQGCLMRETMAIFRSQSRSQESLRPCATVNLGGLVPNERLSRTQVGVAGVIQHCGPLRISELATCI